MSSDEPSLSMSEGNEKMQHEIRKKWKLKVFQLVDEDERK